MFQGSLRGLLLASVLVCAQASADVQAEIEAVLAHPPFDAFYNCSEHFAGQFNALGDALGTDCLVSKLVEVDGRMWTRTYQGDGRRNEDWFGWHTEFLSPCDCIVERIHINPITNEPGVMGKGRSTSVLFKRADGVHFEVAHVRDIEVEQGATVKAGEPIARVGNNGYSRSPHIHMASWRDDTPVQIRFDQRRMQLPPEHRK
ncbi:MAG: M23 family metallopeptidase [Gammaproteobacteria bacterium]